MLNSVAQDVKRQDNRWGWVISCWRSKGGKVRRRKKKKKVCVSVGGGGGLCTGKAGWQSSPMRLNLFNPIKWGRDKINTHTHAHTPPKSIKYQTWTEEFAASFAAAYSRRQSEFDTSIDTGYTAVTSNIGDFQYGYHFFG